MDKDDAYRNSEGKPVIRAHTELLLACVHNFWEEMNDVGNEEQAKVVEDLHESVYEALKVLDPWGRAEAVV